MMLNPLIVAVFGPTFWTRKTTTPDGSKRSKRTVKSEQFGTGVLVAVAFGVADGA